MKNIISIDASLEEIKDFLLHHNISYRGNSKDEILLFLKENKYILGEIICFSVEETKRREELFERFMKHMELEGNEELKILAEKQGYKQINKCWVHLNDTLIRSGKYRNFSVLEIYMIDFNYINWLLERTYFFINEEDLKKLEKETTYDLDEVVNFLKQNNKLKIYEEGANTIYELDLDFFKSNKLKLKSVQGAITYLSKNKNKRQYEIECRDSCTRTLGMSNMSAQEKRALGGGSYKKTIYSKK